MTSPAYTGPRLPIRKATSHKGDFGRVLVVGGTRGMTGAATLAGKAALRAGAGLVRVAVPRECQAIVSAHDPCLMTVGLAGDDAGRLESACRAELDEQLAWCSVLACGPGLGQSPNVSELVRHCYSDLAGPAVFDADALAPLREPLPAGGPRVLTPHPGEFARLLGIDAVPDRAGQVDRAVAWAAERSVFLVLKGHRTFVTDGQRGHFNSTGNPGMATGGSGDVLSGIIAALIGQGLGAFDAAVLGTWVHGRAGDLAAAELGQVSLVATDLIEYLPPALREVG